MANQRNQLCSNVLNWREWDKLGKTRKNLLQIWGLTKFYLGLTNLMGRTNYPIKVNIGPQFRYFNSL